MTKRETLALARARAVIRRVEETIAKPRPQNPGYLLSEHCCGTPSEAQERLLKFLRSGDIDAEVLAVIANMLDPKERTHFKLTVERRKAGKPQQKYDWSIYLDVCRCKLALMEAGKKVSPKSILDKGCELDYLETQKFSDLSEKTIRKYLKFIDECDALDEERNKA